MSTLNAGVQGDNVILPAAKEIALTTLSLKVWGGQQYDAGTSRLVPRLLWSSQPKKELM